METTRFTLSAFGDEMGGSSSEGGMRLTIRALRTLIERLRDQVTSA